MDICDMLMLSALMKFVNDVYTLKKKKIIAIFRCKFHVEAQ